MTRFATRFLLILALALPGARAVAGQDATGDALARLLVAPDAAPRSLPDGARAAQLSATCGGSFTMADGSQKCCKMDEVVSCRNGECRCSYSSTCSVSCTKAGTCFDRPCLKK